MKKRIIRWCILLTIGFSIGSGIGYIQSQSQLNKESIPLSPDDQKAATVIKKPTSTLTKGASELGGEFSLIDHNGQEVTDKTYADTYKLVFFGFTYCPAVCPTELQKVTLIMDELGSIADNITPIFVTVDPERDTVEVMKRYVTQFHPKLVGLTGNQEQINAMKNAFKVFASKVENDMMDEYMMDHSALLYLMDKNNHLVSPYASTDTAMEIVEDIKRKEL